ncbi:MAG: ATP-binding protein, partial [Actinobacteria bacterium]|nr:ATP-binding protein [Actinomycetota bacterium]
KGRGTGMAKADRNPFRPGVGLVPPFLAGRDAELDRFRLMLRSSPEIPANIRMTGLRGVGKTVLLKEYESVADDEQWIFTSLELEPRHNGETELSGALTRLFQATTEALSTAARVRRRVGRAVGSLSSIKLTYQDIDISIDPTLPSATSDLSGALYGAVTASLHVGASGLVLGLDESQVVRDDAAPGGEHPLSMLLAAVAVLQRSGLPIALVLAGLPTLTGNLLRARTYAERMFRGELIGSLDRPSAIRAFAQPLYASGMSVDEDLIEQIIDAVDGYPYFIQLWGAELYEAGRTAGLSHLSSPLLEETRPAIQRRIDFDFYEPRLAILTDAELDLILAGSGCPYPPLRVADLVTETSKSPGNVNVLLGRLVQQGLLYRIKKGQYEYTAPGFHDFLHRRSDGSPGVDSNDSTPPRPPTPKRARRSRPQPERLERSAGGSSVPAVGISLDADPHDVDGMPKRPSDDSAGTSHKSETAQPDYRSLFEVFRTASPVSDPKWFVGRTSELDAVSSAVVQRGLHAIIYGNRGIGKTSLANIAGRIHRTDHLVVYCACSPGDTFDSLFRQILDSVRRAATAPAVAAFSARNPSIQSAQVLTPGHIGLVLDEWAAITPVIIVIDELQLLDAESTARLIQAIKTISDHGADVTCLLVTASPDQFTLLENASSISRMLHWIRLDALSEDASHTFVREGLRSAGLEATGGVENRIALLSRGLPLYLSRLALAAGQSAMDDGRTLVAPSDVARAVGSVLGETAIEDLKMVYDRAARSPRSPTLHKQVLVACALASSTASGTFSAKDVRREMANLAGDAGGANVVPYLRQFASGSGPRGGILEEVSAPRRYVFRFVDPQLAAYVLLRTQAEGRFRE